jgi:ABC-type sugar transport system permease subunit
VTTQTDAQTTASAAKLSVKKRRRVRWFVLAVLTPALLWLTLFRYGPVAYLVDLSFQTGTLGGTSQWVGLANYQRAIFGDPQFRQAIQNTIYFTTAYVVLQIPLGLLIAVGIQSLRKEAFRQTVLTFYFLPLVTSTAATAILFVFLYNPTFGLFNNLLAALHLPTQDFLQNPRTALLSVVAMDWWKNLGFAVVIFYAGLQTIPKEIYEAASVDGANAWQRLRRLTLPLMRPTIALLFTVDVAETLRVFTPVFVMTATQTLQPGGPDNSTMVWSLYLFNQAFRLNQFGYAAALAVIMFVAVAIFIAIELRVMRSNWEY